MRERESTRVGRVIPIGMEGQEGFINETRDKGSNQLAGMHVYAQTNCFISYTRNIYDQGAYYEYSVDPWPVVFMDFYSHASHGGKIFKHF